jgi:GNAT superfamily N-acetyltransferase
MISIRPMTVDDIQAAQDLLLQLGYPLHRDEVARRFALVIGATDHIVFVAGQGGRTVALCHVYARPALDKPPEAVVQALVVDAALRGSGVGKMMMAAAETWARDHGFSSVALSSNVARTEAHAFYEGIGYDKGGISQQFRKTLPQKP